MGTTGASYTSGFDPHTLTAAFSGMMGLFYQNLIRYHPTTYDLEPELAARWEQPSQTEYIFHLSPGVKWHNKAPLNGRALTANDIVFALNRGRSPEPRFINRSVLDPIDKIEATNASTVRVTTKGPDASTLGGIADLNMKIMAPEVFDRFPEKLPNAEHAIGTGAFIVQSSDDAAAVTVRNPDYWKPGLPYLDSVQLINIIDPQSRFAAFLGGQIDLIQVPGTEVKNVLGRPDRYFSEWGQDIGLVQSWVNVRREPFNDPRVYKSLRLLTDHQEFIKAWVEVWFGKGTLHGGAYMPPAFADYDLTDEEYQQILEWKQPKDEAVREALSMLSAAGFTRANPLKFEQGCLDSGYTRAAAELLNAQWTRLGQGVVQSELKPYENTVMFGLQARGDFAVVGPTTRASFIVPDTFLRTNYHSQGSNNFGKWSDPRADQMMERLSATFDVAQRKSLSREIVRYLIDNTANGGTCSRESLWAAHLKVKDWRAEHERVPAHQFEHVWLDT
jgi:peptide/nickel transport system substrate-binding protein